MCDGTPTPAEHVAGTPGYQFAPVSESTTGENKEQIHRFPIPLCVELFCGKFGWGIGAVAEGYRVVGFDILHESYHGPVPKGCKLVLQDVLTLHGSQFCDAALIVASPPCQEFSYMAMPWKRGKRIAAALRHSSDMDSRILFPEGYTGSRTVAELTALFDACFRIQREASEAAGRHIPLVVENVKGAQPWVGRAKANYGSFYLWGDVESVGGRIIASRRVEFGVAAVKAARLRKVQSAYSGNGSWKTIDGRDWRAPENAGQKVPGMNSNDYGKTGEPGRSFQTAAMESSGMKQGGDWFNAAQPSISRMRSSKSDARKAASAQIAKIPEALARHIARIYKP